MGMAVVGVVIEEDEEEDVPPGLLDGGLLEAPLARFYHKNNITKNEYSTVQYSTVQYSIIIIIIIIIVSNLGKS